MTTIRNPRDLLETVTLTTTTPDESRMILAAEQAAFDDYIHPPHVEDLLAIIIRMDRELAEKK